MSHAIKRGLGCNVLEAAKNRIGKTFDHFRRIYVSFSGGKDSTAMLHLVAQEARRRERRIGVLFVDLEGQYAMTIEHVAELLELYSDVIEPYWVALPIVLRNAVSQFEPRWICWDPERRDVWVRQPHPQSIVDASALPFFRPGMEFEEFVPAFGEWYAQGDFAACLVGIRTQESLNRWRSIARQKQHIGDWRWTTLASQHVYNVYPIYDWKTEDIWTYHGKTGLPHNRLYDRMHQAGLTIHQMRICQPYGDDQRKGLWLFHLIEPETWSRIVARVNGANSGALYCLESGNIQGRLKISKPDGHTWESFAHLLLESQPPKTREHFKNKIAVFINWWRSKGYSQGIPDEADPKLEAARKVPSWRRVCKALLRNDYWCKGLSFTQTESAAYTRYLELAKRRRQKWGIF
jgi:predicted phosphoadenosine phosphosulfate sulfurtransferase